MNTSSAQMLISMVLYMCIVIGIGVYFAKRANQNSDNYYLGGRSLGPWVAAFSAEASDMSGWLLMGLPGLAYWCGLADAFWTAIGLAIEQPVRPVGPAEGEDRGLGGKGLEDHDLVARKGRETYVGPRADHPRAIDIVLD